jgi:cytochrome b561
MDTLQTAAATDSGAPKTRYDRVTISLHWATALLVVVLFGISLVWHWAPRSSGLGHPLQSLHVSLGILLAAVVIGRAIWRLTHGTRLPAADAGLQGLMARLVHAVLYGLLTIQIVLGFLARWTDDAPVSFFGLFTIPSPIAPAKDLQHQLTDLHNYAAWAIIILAGGHAVMALLHHYVIKDGVLRRMLPAA